MTEKTQGKDLKNSCSVPIIELTKESAVDTWSSLVEAIRGASYVALDLVSSHSAYTCSKPVYRSEFQLNTHDCSMCIIILFHFNF